MDRNAPMTDDKLYMSLSANTIMAKMTNHVQRTNFITSSTDKYYSLDSEDDFRSGCRNVSQQQQFFSELPSPRRSHNTNYWYSWVQTTYYVKDCKLRGIASYKDIFIQIKSTLPLTQCKFFFQTNQRYLEWAGVRAQAEAKVLMTS